MAQEDDLKAVNKYIVESPAKTEAATRLRDDWIRWYDSLGWYELNYNRETWDLARNRRLAFDRANATNAAEQHAVESVAMTGLSTEQQQGQTDRRTSTGEYAIQPKPWIPAEYKWIAILAGVGAVLVAANALPKALLASKVKAS